MLYPTEVDIDEKAIKKLTEILEEGYRRVIDEIVNATDFGVANRRKILAEIEDILTETGTDVDEFLKQTLPEYYYSGARDAVLQLRNVGANIIVDRGFSRIHKAAIVALLDETSESFGESLTGIYRSANRVISEAVREQITREIALSAITGKTKRDIKRIIVGILQEDGLEALIDKSGRKWKLDRYAETVFRTKVVEARNRGIANRMVENGYDLVQVSNHRSDHKACAVWESKILSLTGETDTYPTVESAKRAGLFHPNCKHAINVIVPELAKLTKAYDPEVETITRKELAKLDNKSAKNAAEIPTE